MNPDDSEPRRKVVALTPGEDISTLSAHELQARIALLEEEIARCGKALEARAATRSAAENFFKR